MLRQPDGRGRFRPAYATGLVAATLVLSAACSVNRPPEEAAAAVAAEPPAPPDSWDAAAAAVGAVEVGWIDSFDDQALAELVQEAQEHNRNLRAAAAGVERARALARQAAKSLRPAVSASAGASAAGTAADPAAAEQVTAGLEIGWEADVWGRLSAGRRAAAASAQAAEADYRFARHSLAAGVAKGYFLAIESRLQEDLARSQVEALEETLRIVELRYEQGLVGAQDVALARSDLASARDRLLTVEASERGAERALELLLGRYPAAELKVRASLPELPPDPPAGVPSGILEGRPDLVAAERRVAAAFDSLDEARAAALPSIRLTGSLGAASSGLSDLLAPSNVAWRAASSLLAPLLDRGGRRARIEVATADQERALALYGDAALAAFGEVEAALDLGIVLKSRREELEIAAREAAEAYRIADLRYREGESDLLDVLTVRRRVFAADTNLISVRRLLLDQRIDLHLALGGSWDAE
ncbi:MAG: TolC family protein [Holophagales bacterium]|nr:TolC family protein [Holophagales bacterium]MYG31999.1 TolC family protein [Holophagales bacterium]MYI80417.1 TolC family protein [Holophagales bacterium]